MILGIFTFLTNRLVIEACNKTVISQASLFDCVFDKTSVEW